MSQHRKLTDEEFLLLTDSERDWLQRLTVDAFWFEAVFLVAIPIAFVAAILAYVLESLTWTYIAGASFIGFVIVGWIGIDLHHRRFNHHLFRTIDKHKNGTP